MDNKQNNKLINPKQTWCIYLLISPSKRKYCGQTSHKFNTRWNQHNQIANDKNSISYAYPLYRAVRKYGKDNFKHKVLHRKISSQKQADKLEIIEIKKYKCHISDGGYNLARGGGGSTGYKFTDAQKQKQIKAQKLINAIPEVKARRSNAQKLAQNLPEVRAKHSASAKKICTQPEIRLKKSAAAKIVWSRPEYLLKRTIAISQRNGISLKQHIDKYMAYYQKLCVVQRVKNELICILSILKVYKQLKD